MSTKTLITKRKTRKTAAKPPAIALVARPTAIAPRLVTGRVLSTHRTTTGAARAYERRQRPCRRANGGAHLDLAIIHVDGTVRGGRASGRFLSFGEWLSAFERIVVLS